MLLLICLLVGAIVSFDTHLLVRLFGYVKSMDVDSGLMERFWNSSAQCFSCISVRPTMSVDKIRWFWNSLSCMASIHCFGSSFDIFRVRKHHATVQFPVVEMSRYEAVLPVPAQALLPAFWG
jgi:hypothetical protein